MKALPAVFYRDPAEALDQIREMAEAAKRRAEQDRQHKARRIRALVKQVIDKAKAKAR